MTDAKTLTMAQGGAAWLRARCGIPTASRLGDIVTPGWAPAKNAARQRYLAELVTERLTGQTQQHFVTAAMQRGTDAEPRARAWYELTRGVAVEQVGLVLTRQAWGVFGGSPDGLIADDGGLEIKCPLPANLVTACLADDPPSEYLAQCHAYMWLTERAWWDLVLWGPERGLPARVWRLERDAGIADKITLALEAFCADVDEAEAKLRATGAGVDLHDAGMDAAIEDAIDPTREW